MAKNNTVPETSSNDPWIDNEFGGVDLTKEKPLAEGIQDMLQDHPELAPETPEAATVLEPPAPEPPGEPAPQVYEYNDGASVTVEHTSKGWQATLDTGMTGSNPEVFKGKTKDEMWQNLAAGKIQATRKIRELNRKVRLAPPPNVPTLTPPVVEEVIYQPRELTADEVKEVQIAFTTDPSKAFDKLLKARTGLAPEEFAKIATRSQQGVDAKIELEMEAISRQFTARNPEYLPVNENYLAVMGWLTKYKLGKSFPNDIPSREQSIRELVTRGLFTVDTLQEAFDDLSSDGLLDLAHQQKELNEEQLAPPPPVVAVAPVAPQVVPEESPSPDQRIVRTVRRPRAGLGIRPADTNNVNVPNEPTGSPSAEELENLSTKQIEDLFAQVRRHKVQTHR